MEHKDFTDALTQESIAKLALFRMNELEKAYETLLEMPTRTEEEEQAILLATFSIRLQIEEEQAIIHKNVGLGTCVDEETEEWIIIDLDE